MNIDFELYRIFYVVSNNQNITKASKELHISQPAISKSIKNLEEKLGGKLFIRTKKGVVLTEEGKEFYNYIKHAIEYINNAENKFTELINLETGCIKIGSTTTLIKEFLIPYLEEFNKLYPKIKIEITTNTSYELFNNLRNGLIDIVFLNIDGKNIPSDIKVTECMEVQDCFVVNEKYKDLLKNEMSLEDINQYPLILQSKGSNTRAFLDNYCRNNNVTLSPSIEIASYRLVVEFAKIGLGIGYVTENYINDDIKNGKLFKLKIKNIIPTRFIGYAISKNHEVNFSTKKLIEIIQTKKF